MKRRTEGTEGRPAHLAEFREADWPGGDWRARFNAWTAAQNAHEAEHGWPGGALDLAYRRAYVRQRHEGRRLLLGVSDYFGLPAERTRPTGRPRRR